jgi:hypothetical protein
MSKMFARIVKIIALVIATPIVLLVLGVAYFLITTEIDYRNAEITTALVRDGIYRPPPHFKFDRACLLPPENFFFDRGYDEVDSILLPDTLTHWTLVLIDDGNKTYRKLYALEPLVHFAWDVSPRSPCEPKSAMGSLRPMSKKTTRISECALRDGYPRKLYRDCLPENLT